MRHKKITVFKKIYACELKLWQISDRFNVVTHTFFRFQAMWLRVGDKLSDAGVGLGDTGADQMEGA